MLTKRDWTFDGDAEPACPCCGGELVTLGRLGMLNWTSCRNCGTECSRPVEGEYHESRNGNPD